MTANKQLLAQHGAELLEAAESSGVHLRFEASAVGAVPIIKVLRESLVAAEVKTVFGIVNGTTNYMLSAMAETGADYDDVLKEAQRLGYAEADPTEDVGGKDAAAKMAILARSPSTAARASATWSTRASPNVTARRHRPRQAPRPRRQAARRRQAHRRRHERARLPRLHPRAHPLAGVTGAYNAVFLESDAFDEIMLFGPGAGSVPTASAVIGDIISRREHREGQLRAELPVLQGPALLPGRRYGVALLPAPPRRGPAGRAGDASRRCSARRA